MTIAAGSGLVINISYDSSVDAAPANFKNAVAAAVNFFETTFTNHITINIQVGFGEIDGTPISGAALGQSKTSAITGNYRQVYDGLADPTLPETDPTNGGSFKIANTQAKLWKLPRNSISDGSIGISSYYGASFDPNNRAVVGLYDGVAILEHEIAEVMGRTSYLGNNFFFGTSTYTALDLFRYSAPGQRVLVAAPGFFSADGIHLTNAYNDPRYGSDGGDWDSSILSDAFGYGFIGREGAISATDIAEMVAIGYSTVSAAPVPITVPVTVPATLPATVPAAHSTFQASINGASGPVVIDFDNANLALVAQGALRLANLQIYVYGTGTLAQVTAGGPYALGAADIALVDNASQQVTVFGGSKAGQLVVAGTAGLAFNAGSGAGTVIAGGGNNLISVYPGAGAQNIQTGGGDDVIAVLAGNNTISAGAGNNQILAQGGNNFITSAGTDLINAPSGNASIAAGTNAPTIFLGSGASTFNGGNGQATVVVGSTAATLLSAGRDQLWLQAGGGVVNSSNADTLIGGAGAATVVTGTANDFVFAGSGQMNVYGGSGATTILGAAGGTSSIIGGTGTVIAIGYGNTIFNGGSGAATVAAFGGSVTINGGSGTGVFQGGPDGNNRIQSGTFGRTTMIGGGDGDMLIGNASGGDVFQAGLGAETMNAGGSRSMNHFYAGAGSNTIIMGNAGDQVLAGTGSATITGGYGGDLIAIANGARADLVTRNFTAVAQPGVWATDYISLLGFGPGEAARALAAATTTGGSELLILSDGTRIQFLGTTGLTISNFL